MKLGRVAGVDDGFFERGRDREAPLVATVMKGDVLEGFRVGRVRVDGLDVTERIVELLEGYWGQMGVLFTYGTIFAGTNVVDMGEILSRTGVPVVAVVDEVPEEEKVREVLGRRNPEALEIYERNPPLREFLTPKGRIFASWVGLETREALRAIETYQIAGKIPEPLRISHLLGRELGR